MMFKLGFVIPLKPRKESSDWDNDMQLLNNTIRSILNQSVNNYKVFVVYSDEPTIQLKHDNLSYIKAPFPFWEFDQVSLANPGKFPSNSRRLAERRFDKGRKILWGCKFAVEQGCTYLMSVDSDDLVSNKLVAYLEEKSNDNVAGWYVPKGYVFNTQTGKMNRQHSFHHLNGSTHIVRSNLIPIPDFTSGNWNDYSWFVAHGWMCGRIKRLYNVELEPVSFPAIVYIAHQTNISPVFSLVNKKSFKNYLKRFFLGVALSNSIKEEFSILS